MEVRPGRLFRSCRCAHEVKVRRMERIGKYVVQTRIGEGGMGVVYRAFDPFFERDVAIKTVSAQLSADTYFRDRFFREARSTGKLNHPNIITVFDLGEEQGHPYLVMEYLEGQDLKSELAACKQRPLEQKVRIMVEVCSGLSYAHKMGITHRDIKPGNIFLSQTGPIKILDFGLSRLVSSDSLSTKDSLMGTPFYMAPEQWGNKKVDHRSDIFATGAVFYEMLTYKKAFEGETYESIFNKIFHSDPEPIDHIQPSVPADLCRIIGRMMAREPEDRYQSMDDVIADLEAFGVSLEARKRSLQAEANQQLARLESFLREHKELLELGPTGPQDTTMIDMSLLTDSIPGQGAQSALQGSAPQDYFGILDVCQKANRNSELLKALVDRRKQSLSQLREVAALRQSGRTEKALEILAEILRCDPGHLQAAALHKELSAQVQQRKLEQQSALAAEELFQEAAAGFASGDITGCMRALDKVLEFEPQNKAALELRAGVEKILRGRADAALSLAKNAIASGNLERARAQIEIVRSLKPTMPGLADIAVELDRAEVRLREMVQSAPRALQASAEAPSDQLGKRRSDPADAESLALLERVKTHIGKRIQVEEKKREHVSALLSAAREAISQRRFSEASRLLDEIVHMEAVHSDVLELRRQTLAYLDSEKTTQERRAQGDKEKAAGLELLQQNRFTEGLAALQRAAQLLGEDSAVRRGIVEAEHGLVEKRTGNVRDWTLMHMRSILTAALVVAVIVLLSPHVRDALRRSAADGYATRVQTEFSRGHYDEADRILSRWLGMEPDNAEARELRAQTREVADNLKEFDLAVRGKLYEKARQSLVRAQKANSADPKMQERWTELNGIFSPEFSDEFLGGLDFWTRPDSWRAEKGKLHVSGPGLGILRDRFYDDFEMTFSITFVNGKGAAWIIRAARERSSYYLFQLTGARGNPANQFAVFKCVNGVMEKLLGLPVGADLSQPDDQFNISVKAAANMMNATVEVLSKPRPEPLQLGRVTDATFSAGAVGFGTRDGEEFIVQAFKVHPSKKTP